MGRRNLRFGSAGWFCVVATPLRSIVEATRQVQGHLRPRREQLSIPGTDRLCIGIYSPERCIADAYRLRGELGYETATHALRTWLNRGGKPADLIEMATKLPRAKTPLLQALNALT